MRPSGVRRAIRQGFPTGSTQLGKFDSVMSGTVSKELLGLLLLRVSSRKIDIPFNIEFVLLTIKLGGVRFLSYQYFNDSSFRRRE